MNVQSRPIGEVTDDVFAGLIAVLHREIYCEDGNRYGNQQYQANWFLREFIKALTYLSRRHFDGRHRYGYLRDIARLDNHRQALAGLLNRFFGDLRMPRIQAAVPLFLFLDTPENRGPLTPDRRLAFLTNRIQGSRLQNEQALVDRYFPGGVPDYFRIEHLTHPLLRALLAISILTVRGEPDMSLRMLQISHYITRELRRIDLISQLTRIFIILQAISNELIGVDPFQHPIQRLRWALDGVQMQLRAVANHAAAFGDPTLAQAQQWVQQAHDHVELQYTTYLMFDEDIQNLERFLEDDP